jgi:hypothetical protein
MIAAARALVRGARRRIGALRAKRPIRYRPDFTDSTFLASLDLPGEPGLAADFVRPEERERIRARVVAHFVEREAPRFFVDIARVPEIAATLRRDRPDWVQSLRTRVEGDLFEGLQVASLRGQPLSRGFDWGSIPSGPGDLLFSVQPHRFGFLPRLALAAHHGVPCLPVLHEVIERWMSCAAEGDRMAYLTPLVVQYRIFASSWTFALVAALPGDEWRDRILYALLKILAADMRHVGKTIGQSYPNNHLLADGFVGWYCGTLYPEFRGADGWRNIGEGIFLRELQRQFYVDGTSFEHSTHYHELGCEMAVAYVLLSHRNGVKASPEALASLRRMLAFQTALGGRQCQPLAIGDTLEDPLFPLDTRHGWATGALRALYRTLFDGAIEAPPVEDSTVERAWWLLGQAHPEPAADGEGVLPASFPQGGFRVLEDGRLGSRLVFRSGPAPALPLSAGHAHADVLSVYLSLNGRPVIVDSGTYTYRHGAAPPGGRDPGWRAYFSGPDSHNGFVSGEDPYGAVRGDFRPADVPCRVVARRDRTQPGIAWHEFEVTGRNPLAGYRRGVVHVQGEYWVIYDLLPDALRKRGGSLALQFAASAELHERDGHAFEVDVDGATCTLALAPTLRAPQVVRGSTAPLGGWVSPRYGELEPAPQLRIQLAGGEGACAFVLQPGSGTAEHARISALAFDGTRLGIQIECGGWVDTLVLRTQAGAGPIEAWDLACDDDLAWARAAGQGIVEVRRAGQGEVKFRGRNAGRGAVIAEARRAH